GGQRMNFSERMRWIEDSGLIVVLRGLTPEAAIRTADVLYESGMRVLEVTVDSPGAIETIEALSASLGEKALVGAGTVLDGPTAVQAVRAGAEFLFAPNLSEEVIRSALRYGRIPIPGVFTPTEMTRAVE